MRLKIAILGLTLLLSFAVCWKLGKKIHIPIVSNQIQKVQQTKAEIAVLNSEIKDLNKKDADINKVKFPQTRTINDLQEGEKANVVIFFTKDGKAMLLEDEKLAEFSKNTVWHDKDGWHGQLNEVIDSAQITGYKNVHIPIQVMDYEN